MTRRVAIIGALLGVGAKFSADADPAWQQLPGKQTLTINFGGDQGFEALIVVFRRYRQIAAAERALSQKGAEVRDSEAHTKELKKEYDGILAELRAAARDEGALPLFDMMEEALATPKAH